MNGTGIDGAASSGRRAPLVAVTGAGGFIGVHVVRALREAGFRVRSVTRGAASGARNDADIENVAHPGTGREAVWHPVLAGADSVVHLAGMAHLPLDNREMRRRLRTVNVLSTERVAQAAADAGASTFVFLSSIKAVSDHSDAAPLTEASPPRPEDCYGMAKLAGERRLRRIGSRGPTRILILRPPLVYGPGAGANFAAFARAVTRGLPLPLAGIRNRRSLIYVGNLAAAIVRCLERPDVPAGTFHLSDGVAVSTPDLARAIARAQDRRARLFDLPLSWLSFAAGAIGKQAQLRRLQGSLEVSNRLFCHSFDWRPPFTMEQGLRATLRRPG